MVAAQSAHYTLAMRRLRAVAVVVLICLPLLGDKKKAIPMQMRPKQHAELPALPAVVAKQKCGNWSWAAAFETMLRMQGVGAPLDQAYFITRLNGGEACMDSPGDWENVIRALTRDYYVLYNGRKLRLEPRFVAGPPTAPDDLIMGLRRNLPPMLILRGRAYLLTGVSYDEFIAPNGARMFQVTELKLMDPYAPADKPERYVTFDRAKDDANEIDGVFTVRVLWQ